MSMEREGWRLGVIATNLEQSWCCFCLWWAVAEGYVIWNLAPEGAVIGHAPGACLLPLLRVFVNISDEDCLVAVLALVDGSFLSEGLGLCLFGSSKVAWLGTV